MAKTDWIATDDQGDEGSPGDSYSKYFAGLRRAKNGQYELHVRRIWGSNQVYLEEHGRHERKFRADNLTRLLAIGISEIRGDDDFADQADKFARAIRNAIYAAQDADATDG